MIFGSMSLIALLPLPQGTAKLRKPTTNTQSCHVKKKNASAAAMSERLKNQGSSIEHLPGPTQTNKIQFWNRYNSIAGHLHTTHQATATQHCCWSILKAHRIIGDFHLAPL